MPSGPPRETAAAGRDPGIYLPPAIFLVFFAFAMFQTAPHLTGGDCGEYVTAGAYLGNTHPPGNPVHHMLSYLAQQLPFADAFSRSTMVSAVSGAGAVALLCSLLVGAGCGAVPAAGTSLLFGFSPVVMRNALVTEVYTLLLLFCLGLSMVFVRMQKGDETTDSRGFHLLAFATGLGMGIHYFAAIFAFPLLLLAWRKSRDKWTTALRGAALLSGGFAVMLYLPVRSLAHPPVDYGSPSTLRSFLHAVTWSEYYSRPSEGRSALLLFSQFSWTGEALFRSLSALVLPLAVVGAARRKRLPGAIPLLIGGLTVFVGNVVLQNYPSRIMTLSDMPRFLALSVFPLYLLAGMGMDELIRIVSSSPAEKAVRRLLPAAVSLCFLLVVAVYGWRAARLYDRSGDFVVRDYLREAFLSLPPNSAVFVEGDTANFSALAEHFVERLRTDLLPIDRTGSHLASIYFTEGEIPGIADPLDLERLLARKESSFIPSYPFSAAYVTLPDWARRKGGWLEYGRIFLHVGAGDNGRYFLPPSSSPVRYGRNASTACELKTRLYLSAALYGDFFKAQESFPDPGKRMAEILEVSWDNPTFFANLGGNYMEEGRLEESERALRHALGIYPASATAKKHLGILLSRTNRLNEAFPFLSDRELADQPEVQFYLGNYFNHKGDSKETIARYEHALSLGYRTPPLLSNLGVAYAREGNREKALSLFREALRVDPGYPGARINLEKMEKEMRKR